MPAAKPLIVLAASMLMCLVTAVQADDNQVMLFDFDKPDAAKQWQTVNDAVMGGVSDGRFKINEDKKMEFYGILSLENNGGFASVRSKPAVSGKLGNEGIDFALDLVVARQASDPAFGNRAETISGAHECSQDGAAMAVVTSNVRIGNHSGFEIVFVTCHQVEYGRNRLINVTSRAEDVPDHVKVR